MSWVSKEAPEWIRRAYAAGRPLGELHLSAGTTLHVRSISGVGYDVVIGSQEDPSVVGVGALREALHELGITWQLTLVHLDPVPDGIREREEPRFYAIGRRVLRDQDNDLMPRERDRDRSVKRENDAVVGGPDVPLIAPQVEPSHESSSRSDRLPPVDDAASRASSLPNVEERPAPGIRIAVSGATGEIRIEVAS